MSKLLCKHCGGGIETGTQACPHCGMPLPPGLGKAPQRKFILFFIVLVIFCALMILWLPPDWTRFIK
jgi:hypothetical protein